jgi:hypothetical protein
VYNSTAIEESVRLTEIKMIKKQGILNLFDCETGKYSTNKFEVMPDKSIKIDLLRLAPKSDVILTWE